MQEKYLIQIYSEINNEQGFKRQAESSSPQVTRVCLKRKHKLIYQVGLVRSIGNE